jgi:PAS domain-containing protein
MTPPDIVYSVALMVAGLVCLTAGGFVLQMRRTALGSVPLVVFLFALSWWDLTYSLFWAGVPALYSNFWLYITYVGAVVVPATLMLIALQISGKSYWIRAPFIIALSIEPLLVLILLFTDPWHGLFFAGKETQNIGMIMAVGPVFWTNVIYSYLLVLIAFIVLIRRFFQTSGIYKKQIGVILVGIGFPWLNSIIFVSGLSPFPNADNTPLSFTIAGLAFTYALFHYGLLDIIPIARHVLIENMGDGVLVLDSQNRLVDINPAAEQVLGSLEKSRIGKPVETIFSGWSEIVKAFQDVKDTYTVIPISDPPRGYFDLRISPLYDNDHRFLGRLVVWRDITTLKRAQDEL